MKRGIGMCPTALHLRQICVVVMIAAVGMSEAVRIVHPADGEVLEYIMDIPLWIRLEKGQGECYEIIVDEEFQTVSCDEDTVLTMQPLPGRHTVKVLPTFMVSSAAVSTAIIFHMIDTSKGLDGRKRSMLQLPDAVEEYHKWWYHSGVWVRTKWRGVICHKWPADQWNYQEILHELRPSILLELGTRYGGSALYFSDVMRTVHRNGTPYRILTVDIDRTSIDPQVFSEPHVQVLTAPSASRRMRDTVEALRKQFPGPMFVIHDADHGMDNVTLELQMVAQVLQNGDYVIVEDTNLDGHPVAPGWGPGPYDAIVNFMAMNRKLFERDLERERKWGFSQAMNGFLKVRGVGDLEIVNPLPHNPYLES